MLKKCGSRAVIVVRVFIDRYTEIQTLTVCAQMSAVVQSSTELVTVLHEFPFVG